MKTKIIEIASGIVLVSISLLIVTILFSNVDREIFDVNEQKSDSELLELYNKISAETVNM